MKPVILIISCAAYRENGYDETARETWIKTWSDIVPDYKFVVGRGCTNPKEDELIFDVDDSYMGMPYKSNAMHRWAREKGYGHVFHCCSDTYIIVPRLLTSAYEKHDYIGEVWNPDAAVPYTGGGQGFWLSPRSSSIIANTLPLMTHDDLWIGHILKNAGIHPTHDGRYWGCAGGSQQRAADARRAWSSKDVITVHLSRGRGLYDPVWMHEIHAAILKQGEQ